MFEGLRIQPQCAAAIENAVRTGTLSHAVILEGADNETRRCTAKEIAKALLCEGAPIPCGNCRPCRKVAHNNHPDLFFIKKEDGSAAIKVDAIRNVKAKAQLRPNDGSRSIFIIEDAADMNTQAQNALLKLLEEPAPYVSFLLTCASRAALLETIRSRATAYTLSNADETENAPEDEQAAACARQLLLTLCDGNELEFLKQTGVFQKDKPLFQATLPLLLPPLRDALVHGANLAPMCGDTALADRLAAVFPQRKLLRFMEAVQTLLDGIPRSANHNLSITALCSALYTIKTE